MFGIRFHKAQPTTYLMKYRAGKVTQEGAGLSTFYYAPVTSLVAVPIGSRDAAFIFQQTARDFQALTIQGHVTYRISEPKHAASMLNFTLKADGKTYESDDPEKLPQRILGRWKFWRNRPSRSCRSRRRCRPPIASPASSQPASPAAPISPRSAWKSSEYPYAA